MAKALFAFVFFFVVTGVDPDSCALSPGGCGPNIERADTNTLVQTRVQIGEESATSSESLLLERNLSATVAAYTISGAGGIGYSTNGQYVQTELFEGKPLYQQRGGNSMIFFSGDSWKISRQGTYGWLYTWASNTSEPPIGVWKRDIRNADPAPNVTQSQAVLKIDNNPREIENRLEGSLMNFVTARGIDVKKLVLISFAVFVSILAASCACVAAMFKDGSGWCQSRHDAETEEPIENSANSDDAAAPAAVPTSPSRIRGQCIGFESSQAWRDPNVDLQIGDTSPQQWAQRRQSESLFRLGGCAFMTALIFVSEISVGAYFGSLSLISNGLHLITDVAMYIGLFYAVKYSFATSSDPSYKSSYSYGFGRLEVVTVLFALVIQYVMTGEIVIEAAQRIWHPVKISAEGGEAISVTAIASLIVNCSLAIWVSRSCDGHSHSHSHGGTATHMARLHLIIDAVQNGIVILVGLLVWIDPRLHVVDVLCTFIYAFLVVISTYSFFRQLLHIVMQRAPEDVDCEQIFEDLEHVKHVNNVHCFHVWSISPGKLALTVHLHVSSDAHEDILQEIQTILKHRYGIHHTTIQISDDEDLA